MSSSTQSVSAVIRSVSAPPVLRIDFVGPDPPPVLLLLPSACWARSSAGPLLLDLRVKIPSNRTFDMACAQNGGFRPAELDRASLGHDEEMNP